MKLRKNPFLHSAAVAAIIAIAAGPSLQAADLDWEGDVSSDFLLGANWEGNNLPNFGTDILRFKNNSAPTTVTNVNVTLTNSGATAGTTLSQILFEATAPAYTLGNSTNTISLPVGTHNNAIRTDSAVTQTIASNILIGDGSAAVSSVVNNSITVGGLLKFTGNITGGTGTGTGTPGTVALSFGNMQPPFPRPPV